MDGQGRLARVEPINAPGSSVELKALPGPVSSTHEAPPAGAPPAAVARHRPVPPPPSWSRRRRRDAVPWSEGRLARLVATRPRRWALFAALLALAGLAFGPTYHSTELKMRGEQFAQAWLRKDFEEVQRYLEPNHENALTLWLEKNVPPDLEGQQPKVDVAVERVGERTADVLVQIKATDKDGLPVRYVFRHRWVEKDGTWFFHPTGILPREVRP
jgi:hypothetical protein